MEKTTILLSALKDNRVVDFIYRSFWEPNQSHRTVLPCQLVMDNGQVYLYAADEKNHEHIRLYDIHKIYELQVLRRTFILPKNWQFVEDFEQGRFGPFQYDESYDFKIAFFNDSTGLPSWYPRLIPFLSNSSCSK